MPTFEGFPRAGLAFLRELEDHNDREWFRAHRGRWEQDLDGPLEALGEALRPFGRPKRFRPYNDQRFRTQPPIKEHVGLALLSGAGVGGYVELSLDGLLVAAGMYDPRPDQIARLRAAIEDPRRGAALSRAIGTATAAGLQLGEPDLKRAPRGVDPGHPRIELLRRRRMVVARREPLADWLHDAGAEEPIAALLTAAQPLVRWLERHVGPSQTATS